MFQKLVKRITGLYKKRDTTLPVNRDKWFKEDKQFDKLYPQAIQRLARRHWTPLPVAEKAACFLAEKDGARVLDIGSGVGKFCISAAYYKPAAIYYGVEQRKELIEYAAAARDKLQLKNVAFIHGNFTQLDIRNYDHFYFYNPFYENIAPAERIDDTVIYSPDVFNYYTNYFIKQLEQMPAGTRLATYHTMDTEVPAGFTQVQTEIGGLLKFWIKA